MAYFEIPTDADDVYKDLMSATATKDHDVEADVYDDHETFL